MRLAVIPARGGSKRIPRKNIKPFCGKPIIAWSIDTARKSGCFDEIIVSTDDDEIAETAFKHGASIPFIRPPDLSDDITGTIPVIKHAVQHFIKTGNPPDYVCCIYATAPFLEEKDLKKGLSILTDTGCDFTFSVTSYNFPIQRAIRINRQGRVEMFYPENFSVRSQDLEEAYHDAGQFYWGQSRAWLDEIPIFSPGAAPVILPSYRVQDIDTPEDWERAEIMFNAIRS